MKKNWRTLAAICMAGGLFAAQLVGCSQKSGNPMASSGASTMEESSAAGTDEAEQGSGETKAETAKEEDIRQTAQLGEGGEKEVAWLAEDLDGDWDAQTAVEILCEDSGIRAEGEGVSVSGQTVTINEAGTYLVTGAMADGQILIDTEKEETVHLVLSGVELSNMTTAPVYSKGKGKVILTLAEGTVNTVSDSTAYQYEPETEDEPDAPVFVKGDLTVNGSGELQVYGNYQCGIRSKGELKVASGTLDVKAVTDGLKGKDSVMVRDGVITIESGKDGIKSNNDQEEDRGFIWIDGGQITITAKDDGIQAETNVIINGGEIDITESDEGIAGLAVDVLGGVMKIVSSDDGINAAAAVETEQEKAEDQDGVYIRVAGGEVHINAMADGIDSNGDLYIDGGAVYLSGPSGDGDGILDYNGSGIITGGTLFGAGSSGMMQAFDETKSTQRFLVIYFTDQQKAGTVITLTDDSSRELGSLTSQKDYSAVIISTPEIEEGNTYHVLSGDVTADLQVEGMMTIYGTAQRKAMGGRDGGRGTGQKAQPGGHKPTEGEGRLDGEKPSEGESQPGRQKPSKGQGQHDEQMPPDGKEQLGGQMPPDEQE